LGEVHLLHQEALEEEDLEHVAELLDLLLRMDLFLEEEDTVHLEEGLATGTDLANHLWAWVRQATGIHQDGTGPKEMVHLMLTRIWMLI
jgi:hypothetical protein